MPIGWQRKTIKLEEAIAEERAKLDIAKRQWLPVSAPFQPVTTQLLSPTPFITERQEPLIPSRLPVSEDYTPPELPITNNVAQQLPKRGMDIPIMGNEQRLPVSADYQPPQLPTPQAEIPTNATPNLLQKGLQTFAAPFNWIEQNITEPFGAVVTSPFTQPGKLVRKKGESWLDFEKRQYEELNPLLRFGIESIPWLLIPGAGQVGTATRVGSGIAGALGKVGKVGQILGKAVEFSPWGLAEKGTQTVIRGVTKGILGKAAISRTIPKEVNPVVAEFTDMIKLFKPSTGETLKLQHAARKQQTAIIGGVLSSGKYSASEAFKVATGALKGALPEAIAPAFQQMTPAKIDLLEKMIRDFPQWERLPFNKIATDHAFLGLLHGVIPNRSETILLESVFGKDMVKAILSKRNMGTKIFDATMEAVGVPKALVASFDISAPARQGILLAGEGSWWRSWKPMMKALFSDKYATEINESIANHPFASYQQTAKLYIAPIDKLSAPLSALEENFMSRWANSLPWVKGSSRAYATFLNKLRSDTFNSYVGQWLKELPEDQVIAKASILADFINKATGRGNLYGLERSGRMQEVLNAAFFSPRFVASRFQAPFAVLTQDAAVRKVIAKDLVIFVGSGMTALTLAKMSGAEVELDPRSSDFGKIKIGNTRIDFWGGYQPLARYTAQFITEERKTISGAITPVERLDVANRFIQSKLSPTAGLILDALKGENFIGESMEFSSETLRKQAYEKLIPMFIQDLIDATREQGLIGTGLALPSAIGGSVQTYPVADPRDKVAKEQFGVSFEELSPSQKSDIQNMPEVRSQIKPTSYEEANYKFYDQQTQDDQAFQSGELTNEQWRDRTRQRMAIRAYINQQKDSVEFAEPTTPQGRAMAGYYEIFNQLPDNAMPSDIIEAQNLAEQYLASLPIELAQYVNDNRWSNSTSLMKEFKQASLLLKPYWGVTDQVVRLFGQRYADSNAGQALISKRKKQMRLQNPELNRVYEKFYASK